MLSSVFSGGGASRRGDRSRLAVLVAVGGLVSEGGSPEPFPSPDGVGGSGSEPEPVAFVVMVITGVAGVLAGAFVSSGVFPL